GEDGVASRGVEAESGLGELGVDPAGEVAAGGGVGFVDDTAGGFHGLGERGWDAGAAGGALTGFGGVDRFLPDEDHLTAGEGVGEVVEDAGDLVVLGEAAEATDDDDAAVG